MRRLGLCSVAVAALGLIAVTACSASDSNQIGDSGSGAGSTGAGSPTGGPGAGVGGFVGAGGGTGQGGQQSCSEVEATATPLLDAADIIFVIDTSGSMVEEMGFVVQNMNAFSQQIVTSGVDVRVVMLAEEPICPIPNFCTPGICVDQPLGSGACPGDENQAAGYYHPSSDVGSTDALSVTVDLYPSYANVLRDNSHKYVVFITDDNATAPNIDDAQTFVNTFTALDPLKLTGFKAHAIYCFDVNGPCASPGTVYQELVDMTGGIHGNLALQDFQPIFNDMANQVIVDAGVPCQYPIPPPPDGEELDPNKVNVEYTDGNGNSSDILQVPSFQDCDPVQGGWYYNDVNNPTVIHMCPATCDVVSSQEGGKMDIKFGCATQVLQPE